VNYKVELLLSAFPVQRLWVFVVFLAPRVTAVLLKKMKSGSIGLNKLLFFLKKYLIAMAPQFLTLSVWL
jgi:hypothetical protein